MSPIGVLLLSGCFLILFLNVIGSITSRRFNYNYARLSPLSFIIYGAIGFVGAHEGGQIAYVIAAAATGFCESTIGWKISMLLKANTGNIGNNPSLPKWISTAIFVTLLAAVFGLVGGELARIVR